MTLLERFAEKVLIGDDCWEWTAGKYASGYGSIYDGNGRAEYAHRVAYGLFVGEIPESMCVLHRCDNPGCVKPGHLFLGTQADNMRDMNGKGRGVVPDIRGERHGQAKLSSENVRSIRYLVNAGFTQVEIATLYGVSQSMVSLIVCGKKWVSV